MTTTLATVSGFLGTIWFTALVFIAGTVIGAPLWNWAKGYLPWNK
tara:strand:+ start:62 stop:196 length:135 start_codon:yes stop_codon:yes gene_type:complete